MQLAVARIWKTEAAITGTFSIDGQQKYFTLELPELFEGQPNVPYKTCILPGTYEVQRLWSNRWNQMVPHLLHVPRRSEIEIHIANFPEELLGCIGIGAKRLSDTELAESAEAFNEFSLEFESAIAAGEAVWITVG